MKNENEMTNGELLIRKEQILQQDTRTATRLQEETYQRDLQFYSLEQTRQDMETIDKLLMSSSDGMLDITDKEKWRLKAIQGRNISHILVNQEKRGGDSIQMRRVKDSIIELEALLCTQRNIATEEFISQMEAYYKEAIAHCQNYCDEKNPMFKTGVERKQMVWETLVNLREELAQVMVAKELVKTNALTEEVNSVQDLFVLAQTHMAEQNREETVENVKEQTGIDALTYNQFAEMVGTHNRGQVEFADNKLKLINNSMLSFRSGKVTYDNFRVRYRFLRVAMEKLGDNLTPEIYARLSNLLELDSSETEKKPLTRSVIKEVISYVSEKSSVVSQILKQGEEIASPVDYAFATAVNEMIGGTLASEARIAADASEEQILKGEITSILENAKTLGVNVPSLTKHQMDNLVKGNVSLLRDNIFSVISKSYAMLAHLNGGEVADYERLAQDKDIMCKIAALTIANMAAATEAGKMTAGYELNDYVVKTVFEFANKQELKQDFDKLYVGDLAVRGSMGLDQAIEARLPFVEQWKSEKQQLMSGTVKLSDLCDKLKRIHELRNEAIEKGLTTEKAQELRDMGDAVQTLLEDKASCTDMQFVANELSKYRFASGIEEVMALVNSDFSFREATAKIAVTMTTNERHGEVPGHPVTEEQERTIVGKKELDEQLKKLSAEGRNIASVLLRDGKPSSYIQKKNASAIAGYIQLHDVLRSFGKNEVNAKTLKIGKTTIQVVQKLDGTLDLIENNHTVSIPCMIPSIADHIERDMAENVELYGKETVVGMVRSLRLGDESGAELIRGNDLCLRIIEEKTKIKASFFANVPAMIVKGFAEAVLEGTISKRVIEALVNNIENRDLINCEEALSLMKLMEEQQNKVDEMVIIHHREVVNNRQDEADWSEEEHKIKNFVADLIFSQETWKADNTIESPSERLRLMVLQHVDTVALLIKKPGLLNDFLDKVSMPGLEEGMIADIREGVTGFINDSRARLARKVASDKMIRKGLELMLENPNEIYLDHLVSLDAKIANMVENGTDAIQQEIAEAAEIIFANGQQEEQDDIEQDGLKRLNNIIESSTRGEAGQGRFTKLVLQNYFANVSLIDKRSMFGSALRNMKPAEQLPENADEQMIEESKNKTMGAFLGGLLKGAGPLMHKMLQGLPMEGMPEVMKEALKDVRSNLAPIPEHIVKEHLWGIVERSKGNIERIELVRSLGAASVGQAFLCKIYGPNISEEEQNVVVKLLRPDVRNRMMREKPIMLNCARDTDVNGGMYATYSGQLQRIEEELDLSIEAANIEKGRIYDKAYETVKAMKMNKLVDATTNSLVLEQAQGETVDKFFDRLRKRQEELAEPFYTVKYDEAENKIGVDTDSFTVSNKNATLIDDTYKELNALLKEAQTKQKYLISLAHTWVTEGIYGEGFYHGDLHAGNMIVSDERLTLIDFGNATKLTEEQQKSIMRMMAAASIGEVKGFQEGFHNLLENTDEATYRAKAEELKNAFGEVLSLGDQKNTGQRILAALLKAQELGLELPSAIFNFSQSQMRLQNTIDEMNRIVEGLRDKINKMERINVEKTNNDFFLKGIHLYVEGYPANVLYADWTNELSFMPQDRFMKHVQTADVETFTKKSEKFDIMSEEVTNCTQVILDMLQAKGNIKVDKLNVLTRNVLKNVFPLYNEGEVEQYDALTKRLSEQYEKALENGTTNNESIVKEVENILNAFVAKFEEKKNVFNDFVKDIKNKDVKSKNPENTEEVYKIFEALRTIEFEGNVFVHNALLSCGREPTELMRDQMRTWIEDKENGGERIGELYNCLQNMYKGDIHTDYVKYTTLIMQALREATKNKMKKFKGLFDSTSRFYPLETFFDVMGNVIMENKMTSLMKIGGLNAISYYFKM